MSGENRRGISTQRSAVAAVSPARSAALHALSLFRRQGREEIARCEREDDLRLAERLFYGVLQNERFLDYCLERFLSSSRTHPYIMDLLRMSAYQILFLDRIPDSAAVNDAVKLCRASRQQYAAGMVNAVLRRVAAEKNDLLNRCSNPAIRYSCPDWFVEKLLLEHDAAFVEEYLQSCLRLPDLCLQVNTRKTSLRAYREQLLARHIEILSVREDFASVRITSTRVDRLPGYSEGLFFVQDDAARASVRMIGVQQGWCVLDACAAPGGKSMAAALDGAEVLSCDLNSVRLERCLENYRRLQMEIPAKKMDATAECSEFCNNFDAVIADVPCSGTGVIRKHPEIRRRSEREFEELLPIQYRILQNLSAYVKPGGVLLYSTCSVLNAENEQQIESFLREHPDFSLEAVTIPGFECKNGMLRSWTHQNGCDGFFAAKLVKRFD